MIRSMEQLLVVAGACTAVVVAAGCSKKKTGSPGPGGAWLVGQDGLMANLDAAGTLGPGYELGSEHDLLGIACRGLDTAFVVGELGTLLRTFDGGASWEVVDLDTTRSLRAVATAGDAVYVGGEQLLMMSPDSGTTWTRLPVDPAASWLAVAAGHGGAHALALDDQGEVWRYDADLRTVAPVAGLEGARVVALSHDGQRAAIAGRGRMLLRSDDGGGSWRAIDLGREVELDDVWVTGAGEAIGVGAGGVVVRVDAAGAVTLAAPGAGTLRTVHVNALGRGLAAGDGGEVLATSDGGRTWSRLPLRLSGTVFGVDEVAGDGHL